MPVKLSNAFAIKLLIIILMSIICGCKKEMKDISNALPETMAESQQAKTASTPPFDLNVKLEGIDQAKGHIEFRQDPDPQQIVDLDIRVHGLEPNHNYLLQRAVDNADGNCTSTSWLTLGKGTIPQAILTDDKGKGSEELFRNLSAVARGTTFDIHFRVVDATTMAVVLNSDCYQFTVR